MTYLSRQALAQQPRAIHSRSHMRTHVPWSQTSRFLVYISAADILLQAHARGRSSLTIVLTCLGVAFSFAVSRFIG